MRALCRVVTVSAALTGAACLPARTEAGQVQAGHALRSADSAALRSGRLLFYNGRYVEAAAEALAVRAAQPDDLAGFELRTSALLFQLKRVLLHGPVADKRAAFMLCEPCPQWTADLLSDTTEGQTLARARLAANPSDESALFFLAKLDLNYVWLQLELLGRKKGWTEYWEARKSLDALLARNPQHVRARVSRAWIDYIVDTRMPRGARWLLGGGSRTRALTAVRQAVGAEEDFFVKTEAAFALWDMEVRERNFREAVAAARGLLRDFPENRDIIAFLAVRDPTPQSVQPEATP
jgi:hypothetical protein